MDNEKILQNDDLEKVSGGMSDEERKKKEEAERKLHGHISKDMFGNVTFQDKTGAVGSFSAADWATLRKNWDYTGNPEYFMETINVGELQGVLNRS
ncbi:MAG: hypothetical protein K6G58_05840 [Lachnospiraceae bacterium]|nr:hypothetical protein [Lachnospiraceae bacterium]